MRCMGKELTASPVLPIVLRGPVQTARRLCSHYCNNSGSYARDRAANVLGIQHCQGDILAVSTDHRVRDHPRFEMIDCICHSHERASQELSYCLTRKT